RRAAIDEPAREPGVRHHPFQEIKEGAAFVFRHPLLAPVFVTQFVFSTASFLVFAIFVPYAVHHLALSAAGVGVTLGMFGVGMVVGALLAPRIIGSVPFGRAIAVGPL